MVERVYIVAPASIYTGGVTALFQLCDTLNKLNIKAFIALSDTNIKSINDDYKNFLCPYITINEVLDKKSNLLIVPETATHVLIKFKRIRKGIYWLSVDNYVLKYTDKNYLKLKFIEFLFKNYLSDVIKEGALFRSHVLRYYLNAFKSVYAHEAIKYRLISIPRSDLHLAQCTYVKNFLEDIGLNDIIIIREPIEDEYLKLAKSIDISMKQNIIAWNSRKAYPFAYKLVKLLKQEPKIKVYELLNVGKENMIKILTLSKVFIDIGFHPGRDRPVREAIALASIPVVNNHGGYNSYQDLPLPDELKINLYFDKASSSGLLKSVYNSILWIIENYNYYIKRIHNVRDLILLEKKLYLEDVKQLIRRITQL